MYKLKQIIGLEYKRTCFCGRALNQSMCEVHGPDIKISTKMVHAQFEACEQTKNLNQEVINLSLTQNQFLSFFSKKHLEKIFPMKLNFKVSLTQYDSLSSMKDILVDFFDMIDFDEFFGMKRLKTATITSSGVTLNFLFDYKVISDTDCLIEFQVIALRNLQDYINWRKKQFKARNKHISKSLENIRSNVVDNTGKKYTIVKIVFDDYTKVAEFKLSPINQTESKTEHRLDRLYQTTDNFFLSSRSERKTFTALNNYAQSMLKSLQQYCVSKSCLAEVKSIRMERSNYFDSLIDKPIKANIDLSSFKTNENIMTHLD